MSSDEKIMSSCGIENKSGQLDDTMDRIREHVFSKGTNGITIYPVLPDNGGEISRIFQKRMKEYAHKGLVYVSNSLALPLNVKTVSQPISVLHDACIMLPNQVTVVLSVVKSTDNNSNAAKRYNLSLTREIIRFCRNITGEPFSANYGIITKSDLKTKISFSDAIKKILDETSEFCIPDSLYTDENKYKRVVDAFLYKVALTSSINIQTEAESRHFLSFDQFSILTENIDKKMVTVRTTPSSGGTVLMREIAHRLEKSGPTLLLLISPTEVESVRKLKICSFCCTPQDLWKSLKDELTLLKNVVTDCQNFPFVSRLTGSFWVITATKDLTFQQIPRIINEADIYLNRTLDDEGEFVETSAYYSARNILRTHGHVTLIGEAGSGKTSIACQLMKESSDQYKPLVVEQVQDLKHFKSSTSPTTLLVDDMFGNGVFVQEHFMNMMEGLTQLELRMKTKNFKIILTSRKYVFLEAMMRLSKRMEFVFGYNVVVDLSSESLLSALDRSILLNAYLKKTGIEIETVTKDMIVDLETTYSFPLACSIFSQMTIWHDNPLKFFTEPIAVFVEPIEQLRQFDPEKWGLLLLILLKGTLNIVNFESGDADLQKVCKFSVVLESSSVYDHLDEILYPLCGPFLTRSGNEISFKHDTVMGAVAFVAGCIDPSFVISYCPSWKVFKRIGIQEKYVNETDMYSIKLTEDNMQPLVERFTSEIIKRSFAFVCTHQVCSNKVFVETLVESILENNDGLAVFHDRDTSYNGSFLHWIVAGKSKLLLENVLTKVDFHASEILDAILTCCITGCVHQLQRLFKLLKPDIQLNEVFTTTVVIPKEGTPEVKEEVVGEETFLDVAERYGHIDIVEELRRLGVKSVRNAVAADKTADSEDTQHESSESIHPSYMEGAHLHLQLESQASTTVKDVNGDTLLHKVVIGGYTDMAELLLAAVLVYGSQIVHIKNNRSETALHLAALAGYDDIAQKLLDSNSIVDSISYEGQTPLHFASGKGHRGMVQLLLMRGANVNVEDSLGQTPLHLAACWGEKETIKTLIQHGAHLHSLDRQSQNPLHLAAFNGQSDAIALLLTCEEALNRPDMHGFTPLHVAAQNGCSDAIKLLLGHGAEIDINNNLLQTALHLAVTECKYEAAKALLSYRSNVNASDSSGLAALHLAAYSGNIEMIQLLLKHGAGVDTQGKDNLTPLHIATKQGHREAVIELLANGADVNVLDCMNQTPVFLAIQRRELTITELLLSHDANTKTVNVNGDSLLHFAVDCGDISIMNLLFAKEASIRFTEEQDSFFEFIPKYDIDINVTNASGQSALHKAANKGDCNALKILTDAHDDINCKDDRGRTPLHEAVYAGNTETVEMLLKAGANLHICDSYGQTVLQIASSQGHIAIIQLLIGKGALVNAEAGALTSSKQGEKGEDVSSTLYSSLYAAVTEGYLNIVELLISHMDDIIGRDSDGQTVVHMAVRRGNSNMLKLLLSKTKNVNDADCTQQTPVHLAARLGDHECLRMLLQADADLTCKDKRGMSPLHMAAWCGTVETVAMLIESKANVHDKDNRGRLPLHLAAEKGHTIITKFILDAGSHVNATDNDSRTALHFAASDGEQDTIQMLICNGADINAQDRAKETPLHLATRKERDDNMKTLLLNAADVDSMNCEDLTPLHIAVVGNNRKCVDVLLEYNADVNAKSSKWQTPMHIAARTGRPTVVQMLIDHEAQIDVTDREGKTPLELTTKSRTVQILLMNQIRFIGTDLLHNTGTYMRTMKTREERLSGSSSSSCV